MNRILHNYFVNDGFVIGTPKDVDRAVDFFQFIDPWFLLTVTGYITFRAMIVRVKYASYLEKKKVDGE